jgi:hypothetical protein
LLLSITCHGTRIISGLAFPAARLPSISDLVTNTHKGYDPEFEKRHV